MPFNIYFYFQSVLKKIHSDDKNNTSYTKKVAHILCTFFLTLYVPMINLGSQLFSTKEKMQ